MRENQLKAPLWASPCSFQEWAGHQGRAADRPLWAPEKISDFSAFPPPIPCANAGHPKAGSPRREDAFPHCSVAQGTQVTAICVEPGRKGSGGVGQRGTEKRAEDRVLSLSSDETLSLSSGREDC